MKAILSIALMAFTFSSYGQKIPYKRFAELERHANRFYRVDIDMDGDDDVIRGVLVDIDENRYQVEFFRNDNGELKGPLILVNQENIAQQYTAVYITPKYSTDQFAEVFVQVFNYIRGEYYNYLFKCVPHQENGLATFKPISWETVKE